MQRILDHTFTLRQCLAWWGVLLLLLLLGAHFYRGSEYGLALCTAGMVCFHCSRSRWKAYAVAFFLFWGTYEWVSTAHFLAVTRMQMGMPWMRAAGILLFVALLTLLGSVAAYRRIRPEDNARDDGDALVQGTVFISIFCVLLYIVTMAPLELLALERYFPHFGKVQLFFAAWYGAFIVKKLLQPGTSRKARKLVWLVFSLVFFGQLALGLLGMDRMLLTGKLHVPIPAFIVFAPLFRGSISMMPVLVLVSAFLLGSAWCSLLCYFGSFDALAAGNRAVKPIPQAVSRCVRHGRACILTAGSAAALVLRGSGLSTETAVSIALAFGAAGVAVILFLSRRFRSMVHCTAFCPMGLVANLLGRLSPWRIKVDTARCDNCGACEKICGYRAITPESRAKGGTLLQCSLCRDCTAVCRTHAITLQSVCLAKYLNQRVFVALLAVVHVVFLAIARV